MDSNVGGHFGPFLKFSGWDCLEIQGKAQEDIILFINGDEGLITIHEAHGIPKAETARRLGIDFPEVLDVLKSHGVT